MSNLQLFSYSGHEVRTQLIDDEPWFVLGDLCKVLDLAAPHMVAKRISEDDRSSTSVMDSLGRKQQTTIVNESGMYEVIIRSDKPEAKAFRRWLTADVIPSIRRTGSYGVPAMDLTSLEGISAVLDAGKAALNRAEAAERRAAELAPAAAHAEVFRSAEGLRTIGDVANDFRVHAATAFPGVKITNQLVWDHAGACSLVIRGNTVRHNQPTSQAISADWAKPHRVQYETKTRGSQTTVTTRLTPRGEARLWDRMVNHISATGSLELTKELAS